MVYVLVYRRFDYYRFDDVIRASTDLDVVVRTKENSRHKDLHMYFESSEHYKEDFATLVEQEIPHFVIMEFLE